MEELIGLIIVFLLGAGVMYAIVRNNLKKVGQEKELLESIIKDLKSKMQTKIE